MAMPDKNENAEIIVVDDVAYFFLAIPEDAPKLNGTITYDVITIDDRLTVEYPDYSGSGGGAVRFCVPRRMFDNELEAHSAIKVAFSSRGQRVELEIVPTVVAEDRKFQADIVTITKQSELIGWAVNRKNTATSIPLLIRVDDWERLVLADRDSRNDVVRRFSCPLPSFCSDGFVHQVELEFPNEAGRVFKSPILTIRTAAHDWLILSPLIRDAETLSGAVFRPNAPGRILSVCLTLPDSRTITADCILHSPNGYNFLERHTSFQMNVSDPSDLSGATLSVLDERGHVLMTSPLTPLWGRRAVT
jgi:hypothetical protein